MKAFSNHNVPNFPKPEEMLGQGLACAATSNLGGDQYDRPPLVSYIFVPTRLTVRVSSTSSDTVTKLLSTKLR
jgi:hypothetical protein